METVKSGQVDRDYPSVLVVDAVAFHRRRDTGILKCNLFQDWPSKSLAQVIIGDDTPDFSICENYWRITRATKIRGGAGKRVASDLKEISAVKRLHGTGDGLRSPNRAVRLRAALAHISWASPTFVNRGFSEWLAEVRPQAIFTLGASLGVFSAVKQLSDKLAIPVVPYFTDDWIGWLYKRGPLSPILRSRLTKAFEDCLRRSPKRLTISDAMAEEYGRRYGGVFLPCMDVVNLDRFDYKAYDSTGNCSVKVMFTGYLEPERWRSLQILGRSLERLRAEGLNVGLDIYTFPEQIEKYRSILNSPPTVNICGSVAPEEVATLLKSADILVHAEACGLRDVAEIALSLSTKIPQYLAAGRAILGVGPRYAASMQYIERCGAGIVIGEENGMALTDKLRRLVADGNLRVQLAHNARKAAEANHNALAGRERFRQIVLESVQAPRCSSQDKRGDRICQ